MPSLLLFVATTTSAQAVSPNWAAELAGVRYETGDEVNCATGIGFAFEVERRVPGIPFVGIVGGVRVADARTCTAMALVREVDGRFLTQFSHLRLIGAPHLDVSIGPDLTIGSSAIQPRLRVGVMRAEIMTPGDDRYFMLQLQGGVQARHRRLGVVVRGSTVRAPLLLQDVVDGQWATIEREWHWRNIWEAGLRFYW